MASNPKLKNHVNSPQALHAFLKNKGENHIRFSQYGSQEKIQKIIDTRCLLLSNGETWNDTDDRQRFNKEEYRQYRFGSCFTYMKSENVAMWMLYGGMGKNGSLIRFSQKILNRIRAVEEIEVGYWDDKTKEFVPKQKLCKGRFEIELIDVLYCACEDDGTYTVKRGDERVEGVAASIVDTADIPMKNYGWSYENEVRLIVFIDKDEISAAEWKPSMVRIALDNVSEKFSEWFSAVDAPNVTQRRFADSSLGNGKIDWDLCPKCNLKLIQNINAESDSLTNRAAG